MKKILIGLTVMSSRLEKVHLTLESLLAQDYPDLEVRIHASRDPFLLDQGTDEIPEAVQLLMEKQPRLSWRWVPNIGSYRKLLPILAEEINQDQLIVTADDDTIYPANWLSTLVQYHSLFNCVICFRGHFVVFDKEYFAPYRRWMTHGIIENPSERVLPTGKDGVLYHASYFDRRVLDYRKALQLAPTADDIWFKWHTAINRVPVYCVETDYTTKSMLETSEGPSLYLNFNQAGANDKAVANLHNYAREVLNFNFPKEFAPRRHISTEPVEIRRSSSTNTFLSPDAKVDRERLAALEARFQTKSAEYRQAKEELKRAKIVLSGGNADAGVDVPRRREPRTFRTFFRKVRRLFGKEPVLPLPGKAGAKI